MNTQSLRDFSYILDREYECYIKTHNVGADNHIYIKQFIEFIRDDVSKQITEVNIK